MPKDVRSKIDRYTSTFYPYGSAVGNDVRRRLHSDPLLRHTLSLDQDPQPIDPIFQSESSAATKTDPSSIGTQKKSINPSRSTKKIVPTNSTTIQQLREYISQRKGLLNQKGKTTSLTPTLKTNTLE